MGTAKQPDDDKTTSGAAPPEDQPHIVLDDHHRSRQLPQGNPQTFTQTIELKAISPRSRAGVSPLGAVAASDLTGTSYRSKNLHSICTTDKERSIWPAKREWASRH